HDGLWCPFEQHHMGNAAEAIAEKHGLSRAELDEISLASHQKAISAMDGGRFEAEIVPVEVKGRTTTVVSRDESPRADTALAPVLAIEKLLKKTGTTLADYDLIEVNEAFAAQIVANGKVLGWDWAKVNVNGGAIALGHPIGATGTRIVVTLLHALQQRGLKRGLAGLCHGGGGAVAMSFELA